VGYGKWAICLCSNEETKGFYKRVFNLSGNNVSSSLCLPCLKYLWVHVDGVLIFCDFPCCALCFVWQIVYDFGLCSP